MYERKKSARLKYRSSTMMSVKTAENISSVPRPLVFVVFVRSLNCSFVADRAGT